MTVGPDWRVERQHHEGACEPCWRGRLDCAVVGGPRRGGKQKRPMGGPGGWYTGKG